MINESCSPDKFIRPGRFPTPGPVPWRTSRLELRRLCTRHYVDVFYVLLVNVRMELLSYVKVCVSVDNK